MVGGLGYSFSLFLMRWRDDGKMISKDGGRYGDFE